jgi:hypothetical protein
MLSIGGRKGRQEAGRRKDPEAVADTPPKASGTERTTRSLDPLFKKIGAHW